MVFYGLTLGFNIVDRFCRVNEGCLYYFYTDFERMAVFRVWEELCSVWRNHVIGRDRQEFGEGSRLDQLAEELGRCVVNSVAGRRPQFPELLAEQGAAESHVHSAAVVELGAVAEPLPHLGAADFRGRG